MIPLVIYASLAQALGFAFCGVALVYWTAAPISQYGVLMFVFLWTGLAFCGALGWMAFRKRSWRIAWVAEDVDDCSILRWGSLHQLAALAGLLNVFNGILQVYASPPTHTPPLIQAILCNTAPLFAVPFSKTILGDRKRYCALMPLTAGGLVAAGIFISILPTIMQGPSDEGTELGWVAIYTLSMVPAAAYSVVQQRYLLDSGLLRPGVPRADVLLGTARLLAYSFAYQPLFLLLLAWVDAVPWFGFSVAGGGTNSWAANTGRSLACSFGGGCQSDLPNFSAPIPVPLFAFTYALGYIAYYAGLAALSLESATFALLVNVAGSGLMSLYFLLPGTNPAPAATPAWSVVISLLLCCAGVVAFKRWEMSTPVHEQFGFGRLPPTTSQGSEGDAALAYSAGGNEELVAKTDSHDTHPAGEIIQTTPGQAVSDWRRAATARLGSAVSALMRTPAVSVDGEAEERLLVE